jgi:hypothetical protein
MNLILGSGVIGCIAKMILGSGWEWIPFKRSRYYSFDIPFGDNFIVCDKAIDDFIRGITINSAIPIFYKRAFSYQGQLMFQELPILIDPYLYKVYGENVPSIASKMVKTTFSVYPITAQMLYHQLEDKFKDNEIAAGVQKFGAMKSIDFDQKVICCEHGNFEFDKLVYTIPLNAFLRLGGKSVDDLKARAVCYYLLETDSVDLEGAQQALVVDTNINFFKVVMYEKSRYIFWTFDALDNPHMYFGKFLNYRLDIIEAKRIDEAIPIGNPPDLSWLPKGIIGVGSNAQWDDFMDVSSCCKRLLRIAREGV